MVTDEGRIQQLEDEVKLLKNEIKHVLTDVEEYILNARNPFNAAVAVDVPNLGIVINQTAQEPNAAPPAQQQIPPKGETGGESVTAGLEPDAAPPAQEQVPPKGVTGGESATAGQEPDAAPPAQEQVPPKGVAGGESATAGQEPNAAPPAQEQVPPKGETGGESVTAGSESKRSAQDRGERAEGVNPAVHATQEAETSGVDPEDGASSASREDGTSPSAQGSDAARATQVASGPSFTETGQIRPMPPDPGGSGHSMANALDLETIFALSQWVRSATEKIGAKRLNILLEICYLARYLPEQSRDVINGLIRLSGPHKRGSEGRVPLRTCMAIMAQLCSILGQEHNLSSSVLSLIFDLAEE